MIIQSAYETISIPKEYISIYDDDLQTTSAYPPPPEYDPSTNTFTETKAIVDSGNAIYGMYYGLDSVGWYQTQKFNYVLAPSVQEFRSVSVPINRLYGFMYYQKITTTNSETGVITESYTAYAGRTQLLPTFMIVIQNPGMYMNADYPTDGTINTSGKNYTLKFDFPDGGGYHSSLLDKFVQGSGSKNTRKYDVYIDHVDLKNAIAALANTYTTVNLYHRDGTEWS